MTLPAFFPSIRYVPHLPGETTPLAKVCAHAGVECAAIGEWAQRPLMVLEGETPSITSEPSDWGVVRLVAPLGLTPRDRARWSLGAMAYALFDGVARASIANQEWTRVAFPRGRKPGSQKALTTAKRQARHRLTRSQAT